MLTRLEPLSAAPELGLVDTEGRPLSLAQHRGQIALLFFGFTRCAQVCPTELAKLAQVMQLLGHDAKSVKVLFVTLDPERDLPEQFGRYVRSFDAGFIGLTGSRQAVDAAARDTSLPTAGRARDPTM